MENKYEFILPFQKKVVSLRAESSKVFDNPLKCNLMSAQQIDFATYCIGNLSQRMGLSQREVYNRLKRVGILSGYIIPAYDTLHTFGKEYLMNDLLEYMREKGVAE